MKKNTVNKIKNLKEFVSYHMFHARGQRINSVKITASGFRAMKNLHR